MATYEEYQSKRSQFDAELPKACANCDSTADLHIHHVIPLAMGGTNRASNLVRLCAKCHSKIHGGASLVALSGEGMVRKVAAGKRKNGSIPLGYGRAEDGGYIIIEQQADLVRYIYRLSEENLSATRIARILNGMAIPTTRGASKWSHSSVLRILNNPQYKGEAVFGGKSYGALYPAII